jgi:pimeloyl-ACP methyl ester carboxylesterase
MCKQKTVVLVALGGLAFLTACKSNAPKPLPDQSVVLLHGMGRTRASMVVLASRFEQAGYVAYNYSYSQRTSSLDELSDELHRFIDERVSTSQYHLVGHSLGNIIIRNGFKKTYREGLTRIVMIAPPNRPAELAQVFEDNVVYRWITGDSGQKLADPVFYESLPIPSVEFAVIAGNKGHRVGFEEPNDGVVQVEATKLAGASDWIVLEHTHTFIMMAPDTFEYCRRFLETGSFSRQ